jgi:3-phenylpropionate/cinnamic acid dioxygenase small subunit
MMDLPEQISQQNEIIDIINSLFIYTDQKDWKNVMKCLADEVLFDMTSIAGGQPAKIPSQQIVKGWEEGLKKIQQVHHQAGNYRVSLTGDGADVFCYGIAFHYLPNSSNNNTRTFIGSYDFHLQKAGSAWKIDKFKFNLKFIDGNKDLESSTD